MKYLAACTVILSCVMLANPAFAGDTRIIINTDLGLFGNSHSHYDSHHHHRNAVVHRAPRVIYVPFGAHRQDFRHDNGRRGHDKHWKRSDRHYDNRRHDNRRFRDDHRDRHRH